MGLMIAGVILYTVILQLNSNAMEFLITHKFLALCLSELIFLFPALPLYLLMTKQKLNNILHFKPIGWKNAAYILFMMILLTPVTALLNTVTAPFFTNPATSIIDGFTIKELPAAIIAIAVLPAVIEEICFRGVILNASRGMSIKRAAIINGVLFAIIHMTPQQFLYTLFLGIIFTLFAIHTQSVLSSILAHFLANAPNTVILLIMLDGQETAGSSVELNTEFFMVIGLLIVISTVFFLAFLKVYKQFKRHNAARKIKNA